MGHKVNPEGLRIGITRTWDSIWYANKKQYPSLVNRDREIRVYLFLKLKEAGIARIEIERTNKSTHISLYTARPGIIIGRQGTAIEDLKKEMFHKFKEHFDIAIKEVKIPELEAKIVADTIARQIEKRIAFRRASKMAIQKSMEAGAKGTKVKVSGRLGGAEISRTEQYLEGSIPLHTFRADISYAEDRARTTYGAIGVKVWVYRGEIFKKSKSEGERKESEPTRSES